MINLEEKLKALRYNQVTKTKYNKFYKSTLIIIERNSVIKEWQGKIKDNFNYISYDYQMNELFEALNIMKKDLEELNNV